MKITSILLLLSTLTLTSVMAQFQGGGRVTPSPISSQSSFNSGKTNSLKNKLLLKSGSHAPAAWAKALSKDITLTKLVASTRDSGIPEALEDVLKNDFQFKNVQSVKCVTSSEIAYQYAADNDGKMVNNPKLCQSFNHIANIVKSIDAMLGNQMKGTTRLKNLSIVVVSELNNAFYYPPFKTLFIPQMFYFDYPIIIKNPDQSNPEEPYLLEQFVKISKNPKFVDHVIAHEYGHYIFDNNYEKVSNDASLSNPFSCEADEIMRGTNELLADVISVGLSKNPKGVASSLFHTALINTKAPKTGKKTGLRVGDKKLYFSTLRDFSNQDNRIEKVTQLVSNGSETFKRNLQTPHNYFSPVRYHLWNSFLSDPQFFNKNNSGEAIKGIFDVMTNAMAAIAFKKPAGSGDSCLTVRKVVQDNEFAINALDVNLK